MLRMSSQVSLKSGLIYCYCYNIKKKLIKIKKQRQMQRRSKNLKNLKNQKKMDLPSNQIQQQSFFSSSQDYGEFLQKSTKKINIQRFQDVCRETLTDLIDKYFINISQEQFQILIDCIKEFCLKNPTLKNWKELAASVIYFYYSDLLEIPNTKQFCIMNNLGSKVFNKRYKKCCVYFKQEKQIFHSLNQKVKKQQNQQNSKSSKNLEAKGKSQSLNDLSSVDLLDSIFDDLFRKRFFQQNRREIIIRFAEIIDKCYYPNIQHLKQVIVENSKTATLLYIFYYNIKKLKATNFYFCKFKSVVQDRLNITLRKEQLSAMEKVIDVYQKKIQDEEENDMCKQEPVKGQQGQYHFY